MPVYPGAPKIHNDPPRETAARLRVLARLLERGADRTIAARIRDAALPIDAAQGLLGDLKERTAWPAAVDLLS